MTKTAWALGVLLVATNAAWLLRDAAHVAPPAGAPVPAEPATPAEDEVARRDAAIARLTSELEDARKRLAATSADPDAPRPGRAAPPAGTSPAPSPAEPDRATAETSVRPPARAAPPAPAAPPAADFAKRQRLWKRWTETIRQTSDPGASAAAFAEVRAALQGDDPDAALTALRVVSGTLDVKVPRDGLRDEVVVHTRSGDRATRLAAWGAAVSIERRDEDIPAIRAELPGADRNDRESWVFLLNRAANRELVGETADAMIAALAVEDTRWSVVRGLQGPSKLDDALRAKLLEYGRADSQIAETSIHFLFRTMSPKPRDVVEFLLEQAEARGPNSLEGLRWGVSAEDAAYAGGRIRRLYDARDDASVRVRLVRTLGEMGDAASRDWLVALRDDEALDARIRSSAGSAIQALDRARR